MDTSHILDEKVSRESDELEDDSSYVDWQESRPIDSSSAEKFWEFKPTVRDLSFHALEAILVDYSAVGTADGQIVDW